VSNYGNPVVGLAATNEFILIETSDGKLIGQKQPGPGDGEWYFDSKTDTDASPVILNGTVYTTDLKGGLHCYTIPGLPPV
jgi:hypothetical protein